MSEWKGILHAFERVMQRIGELEVLIRELPQRPSSDPGLALRERAANLEREMQATNNDLMEMSRNYGRALQRATNAEDANGAELTHLRERVPNLKKALDQAKYETSIAATERDREFHRAEKAETRCGHLEATLEQANHELAELRTQLTDLTTPRVVDEALVETVAKALVGDNYKKSPEAWKSWAPAARMVLAALPPGGVVPDAPALPTGVSMMVGPYPAIFWTRNLSEDEKKTVQTFIEGVLAMKPSAPTAHKPASDEELYELYLKTPEPDDLMVTNSIRAVYNLGRSHGRGS